MDEKGLNKVKQVIEILTEFKNEGRYKSQSFNDRLGVAKEIYLRNKDDNNFILELNVFSKGKFEEIYDLIKS